MAQFPALPLWTDAYLGDTNHLTTIEHGAYLLLLMAMWRSPECRLPDDDKLLARYARLTPGQWARISPTIRSFLRAENGYVTQGRLTDESVLVRQKSKSGSDNARARWLKNKDMGDATASVSHCDRNATTPTTTATDIATNVAISPKANSSADFDAFWAAYPRKVGKGQARKAWVGALKKTTAAEIMAGLARYRRPDEPQFIPHPATWLNGERWNDEPDPLSRREATFAALDALAGKRGADHHRMVPQGGPGPSLDGRGHQDAGELLPGPACQGAPDRPFVGPKGAAVHPDPVRMDDPGQRSADASNVRSILAAAGRALSAGR